MDKSYIRGITQKILNKEFASTNRRKIVEYGDRLNLSCPYCGDGRSEYKKRGNIYFNRLFYICFNCDKKTTFDKFCKDYHEQIDPSKKLEMIEYLDSVMTYSDFEGDFMDARIENLIDMKDLEKAILSNVTPISDFQPIKVGGGIYKYLINRGIKKELHKNIYQGKFWINEDQSEWIIIMLNRRDDKILGLQIRNLKSGRRRMFKIYNYENVFEWVSLINPDKKELDVNQMVIYNKLSYYFNILNIDVSRTITVFEGYLDSLFYPNSIGLVGVNTDYRFLENNDLDIQYFFDNDDAGFSKSEEKIEIGYPVFLWKKLFEDIVDKKNDKDPYRLLHRISKVKDINKLDELINGSYGKLKLYNYFSSDVLDKKWIPKVGKKKYNNDIDYNRKFDSFNKL